MATAIAALAFAVIGRGVVDSAASVRAAATYETAGALARSRLALLGRDVASLPSIASGHEGPFDWRVEITQERLASPGAGILAEAAQRDDPRPALFAISVDIFWRIAGTSRALHLATRRLGFIAPPPDEP